MYAGVILVVLGIGLLLQNFGFLRIRDIFEYWPVLPILWGVNVLYRSRSLFSYMAGGLAICIGVLKLLDNLDIIDVGARFYGPIILISIGVVFLARNLTGGEIGDGGSGRGGMLPVGNSGDQMSMDQPHISPMAMFAGLKRRVISQQLESGEVMAMFGGVELDFRPARLKNNAATIEVNAMFGGIKMRIPENWAVEVRGSAVFGGFEDKTLPPPASVSGEPAPKLILTGNAVFGGVEIEN